MILFFFAILAVAAPTLEDIVQKAQDSLQFPKQQSKIILEVKKKRRTKEYLLTVFQDSISNIGSAEFHQPIRDKGTKFLRKEDSLWMYLPSIERSKRISGHMLNQGVMGSDLSYEELLLHTSWTTDYIPTQLPDTTEQGTPCYHILLNAKDTKLNDAKREIWVDKEHYIPILEKVFDKDGTLHKEWIRKDKRRVDSKWIPFHIEVQNKLFSNTKTTIQIQSMVANPNLSQDFFSHRWLER